LPFERFNKNEPPGTVIFLTDFLLSCQNNTNYGQRGFLLWLWMDDK